MNYDSNVKILSVDPAQLPAGLKNPEMTMRFLRQRGVAASAMENRNSRSADLIFGASVSRSFSKTLLSARIVSAVVLLALCIVISLGVIALPVWFAVALGVYGVCLVLGMGLRVAGIGFALMSAVMLFTGVSGIAVMICGGVAGMAIAFAINGAGLYSVDRKLRNKLLRHLIESETRGRHLDDYRAFSRL